MDYMPQDSLHGARTAPYGVGIALRASWRIFLRNILPFLFLAAVLYTPILFLILDRLDAKMVLGEDIDRESMMDVRAALASQVRTLDYLSTLAGLAVNVILGALITYAVVMEMKREHANFGRAVGVGIKRVGPALGVFVLVAIIVYGPAILFAAIRADLLLVWIAPMLFLYCMFFVALPSAIVEKPGLTGALVRSRELTSGNKAGLFGMLLAVGLVYLVAKMLIVRILMGEPETIEQIRRSIKTAFISQIAMYMLFGTFMAVVAAVSYVLLRNEKDGTTVDELARVFE
jgi:hypothetical protein